MSDNNSMVPFNAHGISIQTVDGQTLNFTPAGWSDPFGGDPTAPSVADYLGGPSGKPLPRLTVIQPKDARVNNNREWAGQFMIVVSERTVNDQGKAERVKTFVGPLEEYLSGRIVGYTLNRGYMPEYDANNSEPLCRSEDFIHPDARYAGKFSHLCVKLNPQRGRLDPVCPHARWGTKNADTGKSEAPACNETYVLCIALKTADLAEHGVETEEEWIYVEANFKSSSAQAGRTLVQQLRALEYNKVPLYNFPIALTVTDAKIGYSFTGKLQAPPRGQEQTALPSELDIPGLENGVQVWQDALRARKDRAARLDDEETQSDQPEQLSAADLMEGEQPAQIAAPAPAPVSGKKGNGKKAMI